MGGAPGSRRSDRHRPQPADGAPSPAGLRDRPSRGTVCPRALDTGVRLPRRMHDGSSACGATPLRATQPGWQPANPDGRLRGVSRCDTVGDHLDQRCDIYAAGLILYEMLTGRLPFSELDMRAAMRAKTEEEAKPPVCFLPQLNPAVDAIVCKAIARRARERHAGAAEMLELLRRPDADRAVDPTAYTVPARSLRPAVARIIAGAVLLTLASLAWLSQPVERPACSRRRKQGVLREHCIEQARFVLGMPECAGDCVRLARRSSSEITDAARACSATRPLRFQAGVASRSRPFRSCRRPKPAPSGQPAGADRLANLLDGQ